MACACSAVKHRSYLPRERYQGPDPPYIQNPYTCHLLFNSPHSPLLKNFPCSYPQVMVFSSCFIWNIILFSHIYISHVCLLNCSVRLQVSGNGFHGVPFCTKCCNYTKKLFTGNRCFAQISLADSGNRTTTNTTTRKSLYSIQTTSLPYIYGVGNSHGCVVY